MNRLDRALAQAFESLSSRDSGLLPVSGVPPRFPQ